MADIYKICLGLLSIFMNQLMKEIFNFYEDGTEALPLEHAEKTENLNQQTESWKQERKKNKKEKKSSRNKEK